MRTHVIKAFLVNMIFKKKYLEGYNNIYIKMNIFLQILLIPIVLCAQEATDWNAFAYRIDIEAYQGKKFRLEGVIKVNQIDASAEAGMWVRVDRIDKKLGFFYNMKDKPIMDNNWKLYTVEGKIDKNAASFNFGGIYYRKGIFYFDDFRLFIETSKNNFIEIPIINKGFENDSLNSWFYDRYSSNFITSITNDTSYGGEQSLKIDASHFKKSVKYGENDSMGNWVEVNKIKLYYEVYGQGESLLLLHGNSQSINAFSHQIPELSKYYKVIAIDSRGQGRSTEDGLTYSYDLFAEDINSLLDYLKIDSVNIVGWSDGGNTGLIMAMKYPNRVKKLITLGANIFIDKSVVEKNVFAEIKNVLRKWSLKKAINQKILSGL